MTLLSANGTEQASEQGEVGQLAARLSQVDGTTRVVDSGGGGGLEREVSKDTFLEGV